MKILYGVQGTGNGHITRARALGRALEAVDIDVDFLFSGRASDQYFDMEQFGKWQCREGLTFVHKQGRVDNFATLKRVKPLQFYRDIRNLDLTEYDLVLCDYEPITARAGRRSGIKVIGVGHQYAFSHKGVPMKGDTFLTRTLMQKFAPVGFGLGLHWHHFDQPILPPIADTRVRESLDSDPNKVVVYLPFESIDAVTAMLSEIPGYQFYFYADVSDARELGNICIRPFSRVGFKNDLATSVGVISNSGFELTSEAIQLGLKILVKPLAGQLEQLSNSLALSELKLGTSMSTLDSSAVQNWLHESEARQVVYPDVSKGIAEWIKGGDWTEASRQSLVDEMWRQVH